MHFSRLALVALPILGATASIVPRNPQCSGGSLQCCQQTIKSDSLPEWLATFFQSIGVNLNSIAPAVGLTCTVIGVGQSCQSNSVCCTGNNHQDGLINLSTGCTPITL
ncbi:hypothetical protein JOM56_007985 [Amanita muscaria]